MRHRRHIAALWHKEKCVGLKSYKYSFLVEFINYSFKILHAVWILALVKLKITLCIVTIVMESNLIYRKSFE